MGRKRKKNQVRPYGPGKFDTMLDAAVYELSLDGGADEEVGSSSEAPGLWAGLMRNGEIMAQRLEIEKDIDSTRAERDYLAKEGKAGVIMTENTQGFVSIEYYNNRKQLEKDWDELVEELSIDDEEFNPRRNPDTAAAKRRCMR